MKLEGAKPFAETLEQAFGDLAHRALRLQWATKQGLLTPDQLNRAWRGLHDEIESIRKQLPAQEKPPHCSAKVDPREQVRRRMRKMKWPAHVTETHLHLGAALWLGSLRALSVLGGVRAIGPNAQEFAKSFHLDPSKIGNLAQYLNHQAENLNTVRGSYERAELVQSGPVQLGNSISLALDQIFSYGGCLLEQEGQDAEPIYRVNRIELRFNPLKRTAATNMTDGRIEGFYDVDKIMVAANGAIQLGQITAENQIQAGLILCFGRELPHKTNMILAEKAESWRQQHPHLIGIDLAGPEAANPLSTPESLEQAKELFDLAGANLGRTVHVGESTHVDIETFIKTIEALNPHRVAHPIAAYRAWADSGDDRGLKLMHEREITAELCFISNLTTKAVPSPDFFKEMLRTFDKFEIGYTFGTDAPGLQRRTHAEELALLLLTEAASEEQILRSIEVGNRASFLPEKIE